MSVFQEMTDGSVTTPRGWQASGVVAGLKRSGAPDLALLMSDRPAAVAAAFTANAFAAAPVQLDREVFGANNANANGTGAVAVDVAGGRIFALDSNNGIIALAYGTRLRIEATPEGGVVTWTGPGTLQATSNLLTGWTDLPAATSPYTNAATAQIFFRVKR